MVPISEELTALVAHARDAAGFADSPIPLEPVVATSDPRHGDYQSNFAFRLGKALRKNPREVAQAMVDALPESEWIDSAEVAGPGFINLTLNAERLAQDVVQRCATATLGAAQVPAGQTLVIDYSSPNIAKRMHVGHLRSTIIGDALARLYRLCGWTVIADNHVGDWGTPFGKLIVAWHEWRDDEAYKVDHVAELQRLYQLFGEEAKAQPELVDRARAETVKLQDGDPANRALWEEFCRVSLEEFDGVYERLGVKFDVVHGESFYRDQVHGMVQDLLDRGIAIVDNGAVIVPFEPEDGKGLAKNPLLIRKTDGAAMYGTTDLATVLHRMETWAPKRVVYETDVRQSLHFRQVFAASRKMGVDVDFVHVGHGMLKLGGDVASTRAGTVLNLVDVLDTAVEHARTVVDQQSATLPDDERAAIAEAVGVGAVKYTDLSQNPTSDIHFDWDRMLAMEGNTAPYLMYANARCHSIFRKSGRVELQDWTPTALRLDHETERALAILIARTPEQAAAAAEAARPNLIADHCFHLAKAFARFFAECRVLDPQNDEATTTSRLTLVWASSRALELSLGLLGLTPLTRM
ncbi:MAG: arginine--tRNA ligase [Myxococcota bacterium]